MLATGCSDFVGTAREWDVAMMGSVGEGWEYVCARAQLVVVVPATSSGTISVWHSLSCVRF